MFQRAQQERAKPALARVGPAERFAFDQVSEELLSQILRVVRAVTLAADESVKRIPVGPAKFFQRRVRLRRRSMARLQPDTPVCRGESFPAGRGSAYVRFTCSHGV